MLKISFCLHTQINPCHFMQNANWKSSDKIFKIQLVLAIFTNSTLNLHRSCNHSNCFLFVLNFFDVSRRHMKTTFLNYLFINCSKYKSYSTTNSLWSYSVAIACSFSFKISVRPTDMRKSETYVVFYHTWLWGFATGKTFK